MLVTQEFLKQGAPAPPSLALTPKTRVTRNPSLTLSPTRRLRTDAEICGLRRGSLSRSLSGEKERSMGLPISPLCDAKSHSTSPFGPSQKGFIDFVVAPKVTTLSTLCGMDSVWKKSLENNFSRWGERQSTYFEFLDEFDSDAVCIEALRRTRTSGRPSPATTLLPPRTVTGDELTDSSPDSSTATPHVGTSKDDEYRLDVA